MAGLGSIGLSLLNLVMSSIFLISASKLSNTFAPAYITLLLISSLLGILEQSSIYNEFRLSNHVVMSPHLIEISKKFFY